MKVVGLMMARDEELCVGMTIETAKDHIDELVFVDNMSTDKTAEIVRQKCKEYNIILHESQAPLTKTVKELRQTCLDIGKSLNPDWFLNMDADTIFNPRLDIRGLAENGGYDAYWFRTLDIYGDMTRTGGFNNHHLWLFRSGENVTAFGNFCCPGHKHDSNESRFLGWNLNGLHFADHMFWRLQIWFQRLWNAGNHVNLGVDEFITTYFNGRPDERYKKIFVLNRMRNLSLSVERAAAAHKMTVTEFEEQYRQFPKCLTDWDCPFVVEVGEDDRIISRTPDLVNVPVLGNEDIVQLRAAELDRFRKWKTW